MAFRLNLKRTSKKTPCERKLRHSSREDAEAAVRGMWNSFRQVGTRSGYTLDELRRLRAYPCRENGCGKFHVGKAPTYVHEPEGPA